MAFLIGGANSAAADGVVVTNSCRFDGSSAYMHKTLSTPTSTQIATFSYWVKRSGLSGWGEGGVGGGYSSSSGSGTENFQIGFTDEDKGYWWSNGIAYSIYTTALYRDINAWYHIVIAVDTTQGTASNRIKFYVNGVQVTSLSTETYPTEDGVIGMTKSGAIFSIGRFVNTGGTIFYLDGYLAEVVMIDGTQYAASDFGEFDEDSPTIWKPKDVSGLTFGNNGFYLDFEDSSNLGNDANGGTDFTEVNLAAADQATDTPVNNFCTLNPLAPWTNTTYSEGNCIASGAASAHQGATGTFGVSAGKWYWEVQFVGGTAGTYHAGVSDESSDQGGDHNQNGTTTFYNDNGGEVFKGGVDEFTTADYGTMNASSDILGVALNADDDQISFYKNGSAIVSNFALGTPATALFPFTSQYGSSQVSKYNFGGCSAFAISSAVADADGYGNFEYAPPSGYFALNSKNLAEYG